ncbi:tetratricopeptide repeat protein [Flavobacterium sp. NRK F10]|uniref:tetratricopeptide repeat protein n=1 Tax=Flavobacterium sp. NRK F10 TaxID=2954931 RepID=UPI0020901ADE|nr:tetratricopeptide repeat protein [Flavobacterium sp. NRK F10]MCO6174669.1 tetratricopeptide repeat protein [Flavobacterium sp. NRK F10]
MNKVIVYIVFFISNIVLAQDAAQVIFEKANENYRKEQYQAAAEQYESILEKQKVASAELYYNLGNCYYKLGEIAPSVYNYEKALLVKPNDETIETNLHFAQKRAIDDIKVVPEVGFSKWVYNFTSLLTYNSWAWFAVVCSIVFLLFFVGYYFSAITNVKRTFFVGMFVVLGLLGMTVLSAFLQKRFDRKIRPAIVFAESVFVKSEPKNSAENAFELHEGTKVFVKETLDNWKRIQLTDKTEGWIKKDAIKELKP